MTRPLSRRQQLSARTRTRPDWQPSKIETKRFEIPSFSTEWSPMRISLPSVSLYMAALRDGEIAPKVAP
jgi:hypothetical protein